jgi:thiamine pyrophosphate-dependent acetolactate synthase large subunit-like protein
LKISEAIVDAILAEDSGALFGVMGDGTMPIWCALDPNPGLPLFSARHEAASVSMADGYARVTGRVGVTTVTCGPGLTHIATPLVAAARRRTPLVVIAGDLAARDRHNVQKFDQRRFAEACEARFQPVTGADFAAQDIREAFHLARAHRGPVVMNVPVDVQQQDVAGDGAYRSTRD